MSNIKFSTVLAVVLKFEGGYSDNPNDSGGSTNMGITRKTLARWRSVSPWWKLSKAQVRSLTLAETTQIYEALYWAPVRGNELPSGLDLSIFDAGVNSGPGQAVKWLQAVVGESEDGVAGPKTLGAVKNLADLPSAIDHYNDKRLAFMQSLVGWSTFDRGWARRVASVREQSLVMSGQG